MRILGGDGESASLLGRLNSTNKFPSVNIIAYMGRPYLVLIVQLSVSNSKKLGAAGCGSLAKS